MCLHKHSDHNYTLQPIKIIVHNQVYQMALCCQEIDCYKPPQQDPNSLHHLKLREDILFVVQRAEKDPEKYIRPHGQHVEHRCMPAYKVMHPASIQVAYVQGEHVDVLCGERSAGPQQVPCVASRCSTMFWNVLSIAPNC